jgi:ABC-type dipeptide/oligopeptide/nickel transport system permease component
MVSSFGRGKRLGLASYIIRRLLLMVPVMIGVSLLIFAITMLFSPYQRATLYVRNPQALKPATIESIIAKYNLNGSVLVQYYNWLTEVFQGSLGWSTSVREPVVTAMVERFPATFEIVMIAAPVIVILGIYLGVQSAVHKDTPIDHATRSIAILGWSLPSFWLGILLVSIFYVYLGWLPRGGRLSWNVEAFVNSNSFARYTGFNILDGILNGQLWVSWDALLHVLLPAVVIISIDIALIIRIMRSSMLEALNKNYIIAARAKGLDEKVVINRHARRNALIPVITLSGLLVGGLMTGLTITETVFAIGGLGRWAATAALNIDMPSVLGFAMFTAIVFVLTNLIVDILYAYVDPRIRME